MVSIHNIYYYEESNSLADEIGEALQRVASAAANSNLSLEKTISWLATISSVSREGASTIGRSLNSIIARFESIKEKGFNEEDATQINDVTKALASIGISPTVNGQLRDLSEIMDEVGGKWNDLSKNEKAYIATTMAGTYQRNRFITLMNNYDDSLKNYENAMNSAGTAAKKFEIYQDSAQAHVDSFKVSLENLWQTSFNSETFKNLIDSASGLIDILNVLINNPLTNFAVVALSGSLAAKALTKAIKFLMAETTATTVKMIAMKFAAEGMTAGMAALNTVLLASPLFWGAVAAAGIYLITKGVDALTVTFKEQKEIVADLTSEVKSLQSEYDKLSGKNFLTTAEREKLEILKEQLKTKKKLLALEKKEENKKYVEEYTETTPNMASKYGDVSGTSAESKLSKNSKKIDNYNQSVKDLAQTLADFKKATDSEEKDKLGEEYDKLAISVEKSKSKLLDLYNSMTNRKNSGAVFTKEMNAQYKELGDVLGLSSQKAKSAKTIMSELSSSEKYLADVAKDLNKSHSISKERMQELVDLFPDLAQNVVETSDGFYIESDAIDTANLSSKKFALAQINDQITQTKQTIKSTKERIAAFIAEAEAYSQTQAIKSGVYSSQSADLAVGKSTSLGGNSYLDMMLGKTTIPAAADLTVGKSKEQTDAEKKLKDEKAKLKELQKIADGLNEDITDLSKNTTIADPISSSGDSKDTAEETAIAWQDATQAIVDTINQQAKLDSLNSDYLERQLKAAEYAEDYAKQIEIQNKLLENQKKTVLDLEVANEKIHEHADAIRESTSYDTASWFNVDNTDSESYLALLNSFAGKTDDASKATVEYIQSVHDQLKTLKEGWVDNKSSIDAMNISILSTADAIRELNLEILNNQKDALEDEKTTWEDTLEAATNLIDKEIEKLETKKDLISETAELDKYVLDLSKSKYQALMGGETDVAAALQEQIDYIKEQKDILNSLDSDEEKRVKLREIQLEMQEMTVDKLKEELELIKNQKTQRVYSVEKGWSWESDKEAELNKEEEILDAQTTAQTTAVDNQIESLNDYKTAWENVVSDYKTEQDSLLLEQQLGADTESDILDQRLSAVNDFKDQYIAIMEEIKAATEAIDEAESETTTSTGGGGSGSKTVSATSSGDAPSGTNVGDTVTTAGNHAYSVVGKGDTTATTGGSYNPSSGLTSVKIYHDGIDSGLVGNIPFNPSTEVLAKLAKGEGVFTVEQMRNMAESFKQVASRAISYSNTGSSSTQTQSISIGNISLPGVSNASDFISQMRNIVAITGA